MRTITQHLKKFTNKNFYFENGLNKLLNAYQFDVRAFALFRMFFAFVMLIDLCIRISDLTAFYTQEGVLPYQLLQQHFSNYFFIPIYQLNDTNLYVAFCFSIQILSVLCFGVGYKTKFFQAILLLFYISLHMRNPYILQGGDDLIRGMLFFGLFLPLNAVWAIETKTNFMNVKIPALAFMFQVLMVYWVSALMKTSDEWHNEASALYYVFNLDCIQWPFAKFLLNFPELLKVLTRAAYYIELIVPLVFFIPFKNSFFRLIGVSILFIFQFFIATTIYVGLFYLINLVALIPLLPANFFTIMFSKSKLISPTVRTNSLINYGIFAITVYLLIWNFNYIPQVKYGLSKKFKAVVFFVGLNQNWGMFAPAVFKDDGWFIYEAITDKNDTLDLNNKAQRIDFKKPTSVLRTIKNDRWRKFNEFIIMEDKSWMRFPLKTFVLNHQAKQNGLNIKELKIVYMSELTPAPNATPKIKKIYLTE